MTVELLPAYLVQIDIICNFFTGFHLDGYYFDNMYLIARCTSQSFFCM